MTALRASACAVLLLLIIACANGTPLRANAAASHAYGHADPDSNARSTADADCHDCPYAHANARPPLRRSLQHLRRLRRLPPRRHRRRVQGLPRPTLPSRALRSSSRSPIRRGRAGQASADAIRWVPTVACGSTWTERLPVSFWMRGMEFPIDIIWVSESLRVTGMVARAPPPALGTLTTNLPGLLIRRRCSLRARDQRGARRGVGYTPRGRGNGRASLAADTLRQTRRSQ